VHPERKQTPRPAEPLYARVQTWFASGKSVEITDYRPAGEERTRLIEVDGLEELARKHLKVSLPGDVTAAMEFVLEGMHQHSLLARESVDGVVTYGDMISRMMQDLK